MRHERCTMTACQDGRVRNPYRHQRCDESDWIDCPSCVRERKKTATELEDSEKTVAMLIVELAQERAKTIAANANALFVNSQIQEAQAQVRILQREDGAGRYETRITELTQALEREKEHVESLLRLLHRVAM